MHLHDIRRSLTNQALRLKDLPLVRRFREHEYESYFRTTVGANLFRGVYATFDEAARSAPPSRNVGYDNPEPAKMYVDRLSRVFPADYPVLFWMARALEGSSRVFDLGGHVGVAFYAYAKYLKYAPNLSWTVFDVPAVTREGQAMAARKGATQISFTNRVDDASGSDVLLAAGSLQYVEEPLAVTLGRLAKKPRHLIVNKTPVGDGEPFVTLQSIGTTFCPYAIFNRSAFVGGLAKLGYELVDTWENVDHACGIPFHPERSLRSYTGFYFVRGRT